MLLAADQVQGRGGTVAEQVGVGVAEQLLDRRRLFLGHPIDHRTRQAGERQGLGFDGLALALPLRGDRLGELG